MCCRTAGPNLFPSAARRCFFSNACRGGGGTELVFRCKHVHPPTRQGKLEYSRRESTGAYMGTCLSRAHQARSPMSPGYSPVLGHGMVVGGHCCSGAAETILMTGSQFQVASSRFTQHSNLPTLMNRIPSFLDYECAVLLDGAMHMCNSSRKFAS